MIKIFLISMMLFCVASAQELVSLGTANTVVLRGGINDTSGQKTAMEVLRLNALRGKKDYPIYLVVDSPGGSIDAGEALIETIKTVSNLHTITIFAASMASAIVQALPGKRLMLESGILMFHRARGSVEGQFETGELESRLKFYKNYVRHIERRNADRMGMALSYYKAIVKDELWMTAQESVGIGADSIVSLRCTQKLIDKTDVIYNDVEYSGCPLFRVSKLNSGHAEGAAKALEVPKPQIVQKTLPSFGG
jgi:ATP-dependent protease ClpP protease subunit